MENREKHEIDVKARLVKRYVSFICENLNDEEFNDVLQLCQTHFPHLYTSLIQNRYRVMENHVKQRIDVKGNLSSYFENLINGGQTNFPHLLTLLTNRLTEYREKQRIEVKSFIIAKEAQS